MYIGKSLYRFDGYCSSFVRLFNTAVPLAIIDVFVFSFFKINYLFSKSSFLF